MGSKYEPPGLDHRPDDRELLRFASLMPAGERKPGLIRRIVTLPLRALRLVAAIVGSPVRALRRRRGGVDADT